MHVFVASADPVPEGTVTGEVSGATAKTGDSGDSTGVRKAPKQKNVNPNPEQGIYSNCQCYLFPLFQWHACKLAKLRACIAKGMITINKIYILHLHFF